MNSINYLEKDHGEIFRELLEFEEMIDDEYLDYFGLTHSFHKLINLLVEHEKNLKVVFVKNNPENIITSQMKQISLDPRLICGHVRVINDAIKSKDINLIKVSLDNDGRMFVSRIKEQIYREEKFLDKILFLHLLKIS